MSDNFDGFDVDAAAAALEGKKGGETVPTFFTEPVLNNFKSRQEGRQIFDEVEMVRLLIPGDRRNQPVYEVTDEHRGRWPREYKAYKSGLEAPVTGTPLKNWPPIGLARAAEFATMGVKTVEQLAATGDNVLANLGPGSRELRERAKMFLDVAKNGTAPIERLLSENERLKADAEAKDRTITDLATRLEALERQQKVTAHA